MSEKILLIYTGGTIGMVKNHKTGSLVPFNFKNLKNQVYELNQFQFDIDTISFENPIDSSDVNIHFWNQLIQIIEENYTKYSGFVILHGSDTMAYSASVFSFMIENLSKPIVFTGAQLPIGTIRTDGKENLITAIEIAASQLANKPVVPEVSLYFEYRLLRGNRTHKSNSEHFNAFASYNYPVLAEAGVQIAFNHNYINKAEHTNEVVFYKNLDSNVASIKLFPGMNYSIFDKIAEIEGLRAIVLETFGSGNGGTSSQLLNKIENLIKKNINVVNISQCESGTVNQSLYEAGKGLENLGVISGKDMTFEAAVTKLMHLQAYYNNSEVAHIVGKNMRGELT
jgi:L-asparaginase